MSKTQQTQNIIPRMAEIRKAGSNSLETLPREVVPSPSFEVFKSWLEKALSNLIWSHGWPCPEQETGLEISRGPFPPEFSYDPTSAYDLADR